MARSPTIVSYDAADLYFGRPHTERWTSLPDSDVRVQGEHYLRTIRPTSGTLTREAHDSLLIDFDEEVDASALGPSSTASTYWEFREADFEASGFGPYTLAVAGEQAMVGRFSPFDGTVELDITPFRVLDLPAALREGRENQAGKYRESTTRSSTLVSHNKDNATAQDYRVADCDLDTCYHPYDQTFAFAETSRVFAYPEPDTASLHVAGYPGVLELYPGTWAAIFLEPRVPKEETGETLYFSMSTHDDPAIGPVVLDLDPGAVFEVDEDVDGESFGHFGYWVDDAGGNVVLLYMSDKQGGNVLRRAVSALPTSSATQLDFTRRCTTPSDQFVTLRQQPFCDPLGMLNASGKTLHDPTIDPEPTGVIATLG